MDDRPVGTARPSLAVAHGRRDRPLVALTFDADLSPSMLERMRTGAVAGWYDPSIAEALIRSEAPATFFVTGLWARTYARVLRDLAAVDLFEIANHSYSHAAFAAPCYDLPILRTEAEKRYEITEGARAILELTGTSPLFFRFPGGCHAESDAQLVVSLGQRPIQWDVNSGDAFQPDANAIADRVMRQVQPGSIVVMHLVGAPNAPATATALSLLLPRLRETGLRPVHLSELLRD